MALLELLNGFVYDPCGIRSGILNYSSILSLASMTLVSFEVTSWAHTSASLMVDPCNIAHLWRTRVQSPQVSDWQDSQLFFLMMRLGTESFS